MSAGASERVVDGMPGANLGRGPRNRTRCVRRVASAGRGFGSRVHLESEPVPSQLPNPSFHAPRTAS
eukprot:5440830-Alexandrium_andersonii.AAC.1